MANLDGQNLQAKPLHLLDPSSVVLLESKRQKNLNLLGRFVSPRSRKMPGEWIESAFHRFDVNPSQEIAFRIGKAGFFPSGMENRPPEIPQMAGKLPSPPFWSEESHRSPCNCTASLEEKG
jgi:hypothetical protein